MISLLVGALLLSAQTKGDRTVLVGLSRARVMQLYGPPADFFDAGSQLHFRHYPPVPVGLVWEEHFRKTPTNEYKIGITYELDESASRLHPTLRVDNVRIDVDRPKAARLVLSDLREVVSICQHGCRINSGDLSNGLVLTADDVVDRIDLWNCASLDSEVSEIDIWDSRHGGALTEVGRWPAR